MPSNKSSSTTVHPGTGLPAATSAGVAEAMGAALQAHINDPVGAHADSAISATPAASTWGPFALTASDVNAQLRELLDGTNAPCNSIVVDGTNSPYTLDSNLASTYIPHVLVNTGATRTITLPQTPADHKGKMWIIRDYFGAAVAYPFTVQRWPLSTYYVNGLSGPNWKSFNGFTIWFVFCDGTDFFIHELPDYIGKSRYTVTSYALHPAGYTLDQYGERDEKILVTTLASPTASPIITFPDPSTATGNAGRQVWVIDATGYSEADNIILRTPGTVTMNGTTADIVVGKKYGAWLVTCNGTNYIVEEKAAPDVPVIVSGGNSPYTVDTDGVRNSLIHVRTLGARTIIFPAASGCKGRVWRIVDVEGASHINNITLQPNGGDAINSYAGSITVGKSFGEWIVTCDGIGLYVQEMSAPTMQAPLVTTSPFDLDAGALQYDDVYVDATGGNRNLVLPQYPASHKNQKWHIYNVPTSGAVNGITLQRFLLATYTINGVAGDHLLKPAGTTKDFGHWVVLCDGSNFFVHEIPPTTGGLDWANTWSRTNTFSGATPISFSYVGDQTLSKGTSGDIDWYVSGGEYRIRFGATTRRFVLQNSASETFFLARESISGTLKYAELWVGPETTGTTTPFAATAAPDRIAQPSRTSDYAPGFEIGAKGQGPNYTRIMSGGAEQAGEPRTHLIFDLNNNEGLGETVTILPTMSVLINPATTSSYYTLKTNVGGARSRGRKPPASSVCLLEAWVCMLGVDDSGSPPYPAYNNSRWVTMRRACGYCANDGTTYTVQDDTQVFLSDDSGLTNPPPLARIIADTDGFHIQVKAGSDIADWRQLFWGYLKVTTLTFSTSWDESV